MGFIDPHLHTHMFSGRDFERLAMSGLEAAVLPAVHLMRGMEPADSVLMLWNRMLDFEIKHCKTFGVEGFVTLSVPFYGVNAEGIEKCFAELPKYLKHERCVGLGEIGLDAGIEDEVKLFRRHLKLAKEFDMPIIVHSPIRNAPQVQTVIRQIVEIIKDEKFPMDKVLLDHSAANTVDYRLSTGAMVGLSVCHDKTPPEMAAEVVKDRLDKIDQLVINSEVGYGNDGYFSVPRVIMAMKMLGLKKDVIEKVTYENPKRFFKLTV